MADIPQNPTKPNHIYVIYLYKEWVIVFSDIGNEQFRKVKIFMSYRVELPGILLMCLSVPFLITPSASTITGTVIVLWCYIFSISISSFLYLLISFFD